MFGCASWRTIDRADLAKAVEGKPHSVRVKLKDSSYTLQRVTLSGDTLRGSSQPTPSTEVAIPLTSIDSFAIRHYHPKTAIVVTGLVVGLTAFIVVNANRGGTVY